MTDTLLNDIHKHVSNSIDHIYKIKRLLQAKIHVFWQHNPVRLGGIGKLVQVDETKLIYNAENHKGREDEDDVWAITIVDTSTQPAKGFARVVENREAATLLPIVASVVIDGTTIHVNQWASYKRLPRQNGYAHATVCHKYHFVDPETGTHTQHVESFNNKLKLSLKAR